MIQYDFPRMEQLAGQLNSHFGSLDSLASNLKGQVTRLDANWKSQSASDSYRGAQAKWDSAFGDSRDHLQRLSAQVRQSAEKMRSADAKAASFFQ